MQLKSFIIIASLFLGFSLHISYSVIPEKKIYVVVPNYNNPETITKECLNSILSQNYENFEIIFSDDCSPQANIEQTHKKLMSEIDTKNKIIYHRNQERLGPIGNQWHAFHSINPLNIEDNNNIIVATLDGDDVFLHRNVLKKVNELHEYAWVTYGNFSYYPSMHNDYCAHEVSHQIVKDNAWRTVPGFPTTHLRTARLSLVKDIPLKNYIYDGRFFPAAGDATFMYAACEKAGLHAIFNPERVYGYRITDQAENKVMTKLHQECAQAARNQKPCKPLQNLPIQHPDDYYKTTLIILSDNKPDDLSTLITSISTYVHELEAIIVVYQAGSKLIHEKYTALAEVFENILFVQKSSMPQLLFTLESLTSNFVLIARDSIIISEEINLKICINALQKTHAYGFCLNASIDMLQAPICIDYCNKIFAWQTNHMNKTASFNFLNLSLYRNKKFQKILKKSSLYDLEDQLKQCLQYKNKIMLSFSNSKAIAF